MVHNHGIGHRDYSRPAYAGWFSPDKRREYKRTLNRLDRAYAKYQLLRLEGDGTKADKYLTKADKEAKNLQDLCNAL